MADFQAQPRKKIALDNSKLSLRAPSTAEGKTASLIWMLYKNNPRIVVWTRDPQDETERNKGGKIQAELNLPIMFSILENLNFAITAEPGWRAKLENKNYTFFGGKKSDQPQVLTEIWVGKDKEGFVYISVTAPNRPIIKFRIQPDDFHCWYDADGQKTDPARLAAIYVKGYVDILKSIYSHLAITEFVDIAAEMREKDNKRQGGGGWNNNRGGNQGGGGYQKSNDSGFGGGDDLPF